MGEGPLHDRSRHVHAAQSDERSRSSDSAKCGRLESFNSACERRGDLGHEWCDVDLGLFRSVLMTRGLWRQGMRT
jgi:hypothetical protein